MKRMIDNKEFDKIKNDVSELNEDVNDLNEKVDNIEVIPTITIELSQMLSQNTVQLTNEQFEILDNNDVVIVNLPNDTQQTYIKTIIDTTNNIYVFNAIYGYDDLDKVFVFNRVSINDSTLVATLSIITIPKSKQLYQHNICVAYTSGSVSYAFVFKIINEKSDSYTYETLYNLINQSQYVVQNKFWEAILTCYVRDLTNFKDYRGVIGSYYVGDNHICGYVMQNSNNAPTVVLMSNNTNFEIIDTVNTL